MTSRATNRPSIALVAHAIHDGAGMERVFAELIRRAHHEYRFLVVSRQLASDLRPLVEWKRVPAPRRPIPLLITLFSLLAGYRLRRIPADLVHTQGALVPNRVDLASVHFCHAGFVKATSRLAPSGAPLFRRLNHAVVRVLALGGERWTYRAARVRLLAAVSRGVATELRRHYPGVPVEITPNGVESQRFRPDENARRQLRETAGVRPDEVIALFVGSDWDRKGLEIAVRSLAEPSAANASKLRLWVVGSGDDRRLLALAHEQGVGDRVHFFGYRSDTTAFYQAADIFVLPSLYETFSLVAYEAAASALPIVSTRVSGVDELVGENAGVFVDRTPRAVAEALLLLASDDALRRKMGETARVRALEYTWERSVMSVLTLYKRLLPGAVHKEVVAA
jgi:glycosyltransferase involved in cell wall biosynthesis